MTLNRQALGYDEILHEAAGETLRFDPIAHVEDMLGERVTHNPDDHLGHLAVLQQAMKDGDRKRNMMMLNDDTRWGISADEFITIVRDLGFEEVMDEPFTDRRDDRTITNHFMGFHEPETGMFMVVETYGGGESINKANLYYNWIPNVFEEAHHYTSSGGYTDEGIHYGDADVRKGLKHRIYGLLEHGDFVPNWVKSPNPWLVSYMDEIASRDMKTRDLYGEQGYFNQVINERTARLPDAVQQAMGVKPKVDFGDSLADYQSVDRTRRAELSSRGEQVEVTTLSKGDVLGG